jgi:ABC-type multidrug transport system fused ATPase/permease subunit
MKLPSVREDDLKRIYNKNRNLFILEGAKWFEIPVKGAVKYDHVWLSYRNDEFHELQDINFEVNPGEVIAILGATGSGKTSIIRLLGLFYEQDRGQITIDDVDIRDVPKKELRKLIGFVPQEAFLFSTTIRENLIIGRSDEVSMDEIINACKLANIHDFIDSLPKKYESVVGQRGVTLSGGQRQRLSIARALIARPKILVLDDATSSVDVDTEYQIQRGFRTMFKDSTTFIITQRLSSVRHADKIIVLEKGKITSSIRIVFSNLGFFSRCQFFQYSG